MEIKKGALTALIDDDGAFLRQIAIGNEEAFRGIGFVARDANWGTATLTGAARSAEADSVLRLESGGELATASGDLSWSIVWTFTENCVEARAEWSTRAGFLTNRTGFVVLHSLGASRGRPVRITHSDGRLEVASFPELVSPHQPFLDISAMEYKTVGGSRLRVVFEGEVFEIEDQRNWSDASYKTYCRPLRLPFPYPIEPGQTHVQAVRMEVVDKARVRQSREPRRPSIGAEARMPVIGASLPPGPLDKGAPAATAALGLNITAIELDLSAEAPFEEFDAKLALAGGRARIDIRPAERGIVLDGVRRIVAALGGRQILGLTLWGADDALINEARLVLGVPIGAGSAMNFAELNRTYPLPASADYLAWASNPTVHGVTDDTIGETTETSDDILATIEGKAPGRPLHVGPLTLGARFNPAATATEGGTGAPTDPRQTGVIGAAWAVATLAGYLSEDVHALTFFEPFGARGLVSPSGALTPAGLALKRLAVFAGASVRPLRWSNAPRARGLMMEGKQSASLCIAHARKGRDSLRLPEGEWRAEALCPAGFSSEAIAGGFLEVGDFSVHWLGSAERTS
jgi:hypothetical protein